MHKHIGFKIEQHNHTQQCCVQCSSYDQNLQRQSICTSQMWKSMCSCFKDLICSCLYEPLCCCIQYISLKHSLLSIRKIAPTLLHRRSAFTFALLGSCITIALSFTLPFFNKLANNVYRILTFTKFQFCHPAFNNKDTSFPSHTLGLMNSKRFFVLFSHLEKKTLHII